MGIAGEILERCAASCSARRCRLAKTTFSQNPSEFRFLRPKARRQSALSGSGFRFCAQSITLPRIA
jgi:hypothetical protein